MGFCRPLPLFDEEGAPQREHSLREVFKERARGQLLVVTAGSRGQASNVESRARYIQPQHGGFGRGARAGLWLGSMAQNVADVAGASHVQMLSKPSVAYVRLGANGLR